MNSKIGWTAENASRRVFLRRSAIVAGSTLVSAATLQTLNACSALGRDQQRFHDSSLGDRNQRPSPFTPYGNLMPCADQDGDKILALPKGFRYVTFSKLGAPMSDGNLTPRNLDGMGVFAHENRTVRLIRNHEVRNAPGDRDGALEGPEETRYDPIGMGGTVTVDFDTRSFTDAERFPPVVRDFVSLNGTIVNCSGGYAFGDAGWITCEETTDGPAEGWRRKHGYAFFTPVGADTCVMAQPIVAMGRFKHEAAVADTATGVVYQTEDDGSNSGFYRFLPNEPVDLAAGGSLQMLRIKSKPQADLRDGQTVGRRLPVDWVTIDDPDPDLENHSPGVFHQGHRRGGARFNRLEGIFRGEHGSFYFTSNSGGDAKNGEVDDEGYFEGYGQIWRYLPKTDKRGELELVYESPGGNVLHSPDNICITPNGGILTCEDNSSDKLIWRSSLPDLTSSVDRLIGFTREGIPFELAVNLLNGTEFAGACFDPYGHILFVNIYGDGAPGSGMTCAISGPWSLGPL